MRDRKSGFCSISHTEYHWGGRSSRLCHGRNSFLSPWRRSSTTTNSTSREGGQSMADHTQISDTPREQYLHFSRQLADTKHASFSSQVWSLGPGMQMSKPRSIWARDSDAEPKEWFFHLFPHRTPLSSCSKGGRKRLMLAFKGLEESS